MNREPTNEAEHFEIALLQEDIFNEALALLSNRPKREYTEQ